MHVTVIKREILDRHPRIAINLAKPFEAAKLGYKRLQNSRDVPLACVRKAWAEGHAQLGADPVEYLRKYRRWWSSASTAMPAEPTRAR